MELNEAFDADVLRGLHTLSLESAIRTASDLIRNSCTRPSKKQHLIRDISRAKTSADVSRIMYMTTLAGLGLASLNSPWQRLHGAPKEKNK